MLPLTFNSLIIMNVSAFSHVSYRVLHQSLSIDPIDLFIQMSFVDRTLFLV